MLNTILHHALRQPTMAQDVNLGGLFQKNLEQDTGEDPAIIEIRSKFQNNYTTACYTTL